MGNVVSKNNDDIKHIVLSAMMEVQAKRNKKRVFDCQNGAFGMYLQAKRSYWSLPRHVIARM